MCQSSTIAKIFHDVVTTMRLFSHCCSRFFFPRPYNKAENASSSWCMLWYKRIKINFTNLRNVLSLASIMPCEWLMAWHEHSMELQQFLNSKCPYFTKLDTLKFFKKSSGGTEDKLFSLWMEIPTAIFTRKKQLSDWDRVKLHLSA